MSTDSRAHRCKADQAPKISLHTGCFSSTPFLGLPKPGVLNAVTSKMTRAGYRVDTSGVPPLETMASWSQVPPSPSRRLHGVLHDSIFPLPPVGYGMRNKEDSLPPDQGEPISC